MKTKTEFRILIAEDDDDDKLLIIKAFEKVLPLEYITCVSDGEELIQYLEKTNSIGTPLYPVPNIILLDLNMPRKDGKKTLQEIKNHEEFRKIPVIIFTTSNLKEDIHITYKMGTNSFIRKPGNFNDLVKVAQEIKNYWSKTVVLPN